MTENQLLYSIFFGVFALPGLVILLFPRQGQSWVRGYVSKKAAHFEAAKELGNLREQSEGSDWVERLRYGYIFWGNKFRLFGVVMLLFVGGMWLAAWNSDLAHS